MIKSYLIPYWSVDTVESKSLMHIIGHATYSLNFFDNLFPCSWFHDMLNYMLGSQTSTSLINSLVNSSGIIKMTPAVRNVTSRVSCAQDQGPSRAGSVHLLYWSCKAPGCVLAPAQTASMNMLTSANSVTPAARPAQVQTERFVHKHPVSISCKSVNLRYQTMCVCLQTLHLRVAWHAIGEAS